MRRLAALLSVVLVLTVLAGTLLDRSAGSPAEPTWMKYRTGRQPVVGLGDPELVRSYYEEWKRDVEDPYAVELVASELLDQPERAAGWFRIDYDSETLAAEIHGLALEPVDLWLIDSPDDTSAMIDPDDCALWVGTFQIHDGIAALDTSVAGITEDEFSIDLAVVTPQDRLPHEGGLLYGVPSLFQRLHALEERMAREAEQKSQRLLSLAAVSFQSGGVPTGFPQVFTDLATEGENLFFNETFKGNGRSCGSCHFAVNDFTIDKDLLATLRPDDPLFAAETQPPLIFGDPQNLDENGNPRRFENPELMRAFGLICENQDGFGDLENRFNMRGVPHNIGMKVSVARPGGSIGFPDGPDERTGWSGDGAPFGTFSCGGAITTPGIVVRGGTRDFALGAVIQHFPRTMARSFCGSTPDFRLPTDHELDAFGIFLFALGRQNELNLAAGTVTELILADGRAEKGKVLFRDPGASGNPITCNNCHTNAGANTGLNPNNNTNIDTNVEEFIQNRLDDPNFTVVGEPRPIDGGFGLNPQGNFKELIPGPGNGNENFGNGTFNTVSLVEAADSAPFFHANVAFTVEESIEFYASTEFGGLIVFTTEERDAVAAFMRAINALDNIENLAARRAKKAIDALLISNPNANDVIDFLLEVAIADTSDAIEVLEASDLHNSGDLPVNAVRQLDRANQRFRQAQNVHPPDSVRIAKIEEGLEHLKNAVAIIRVNP